MKIIVNDDQELVEEVRRQLAKNNGYCPCKLLHTEDNKCMCKDFRDSVTIGECYCGLYVKIE